MNKIFKYSGFGNFSNDFGWDKGMECDVEKEVLLTEALEDQDRAVEYSWTFNNASLPVNPDKGVYQVFYNEHGGTRNTWGFVVAESKKEAQRLLNEYSERWEIVEYNRD